MLKAEYSDTAPNLEVGTSLKKTNYEFYYFLGSLTMKYFKGLLAIALIWAVPVLTIFIFDSCQKAKYDNSKSGEAAKKFSATLDAARSDLGSIQLKSTSTSQNQFIESTDGYYLDFPIGTSPEVITEFSSNVTINSLTNVLVDHGVSIDDSINTNADLEIQIDDEPVIVALQPLVVEAKNYLMAKGATSQQIIDMLQEEDADEIDLIPFVKALTAIEQDQYTVRKINLPLINDANALNAFIECGLYALGGDALYALSQSTASTWTWGAMKSAFKIIAKKFLGPIGVAVAVISFGVCMLGHI